MIVNGFAQKFNTELFLAGKGLPSNNIQACLTDSTGYLWIATNKGLCRYDGYAFQKNSAITDMIVSVTRESSNIVYYSTQTGLTRFNPYTNNINVLKKNTFNDSDPCNDHFNKVFTDDEGKIWCTDFRQLKYYAANGTKSKIFPIAQFNSSTDNLATFCNPSKGTVWAASLFGLYIWQKNSELLKRSVNPELANLSYSTCSVIGNDTVLLASKNKVYVVRASTQQIVSTLLLPKIDKQPIISITISETKDNKSIYVATQKAVYLLEIHLGLLQPYFSMDGYSGSINQIFSHPLLPHLWISTTHGLIKLTPFNSAIANYYLPQNSVSEENNINSIISAKEKGSYFIGTPKTGLWKYNTLTKTAIQIHKSPLSINHLIYNNNLLIISSNQGLFAFENNQFKRIQLPNKYADASIKKVAIAQNDLWVLAKGLPVLVLNKQTFDIKFTVLQNTIFNEKNRWNDIAVTNLGDIYLAGWIPDSYGIARFNPLKKAFEDIVQLKIAEESKLVTDYFNRLVPSSSYGMLLTGFGGFNILNAQGRVVATNSSVNQPLAHEHVEGIAEMNNRQIWFGTEEGVQIWLPSNNHYYTLTSLDGLPTNNVVFGFDKIDQNLLAIGHNNAFSLLQTDKIFASSLINRLEISRVMVNGISKSFQNHSISVAPNERNLSIAITALNFNAYENSLKYQYRINNGEWYNLGNNPVITLASFKSGNYTIEANVTDKFGNSQAASIKFDINAKPFLYETWWFSLAIVLIVAAIIIAFFLYRIAQLKKINVLRHAISQDLHDDVGATLSSINILSTLVANQEGIPKKSQAHLSHIKEDVQQLQQKLEEIIWSLKDDTGNLYQIFTKLIAYANQLFEAQDIAFNPVFDDILNDTQLPFQIRQQLYLMVKESINNIAKHSNATEVILAFTKEKNTLKILVQDNGIGIDERKINERNGIRGLYQRSKQLGINLQIDSQPRQGTKIYLSIKCK